MLKLMSKDIYQMDITTVYNCTSFTGTGLDCIEVSCFGFFFGFKI